MTEPESRVEPCTCDCLVCTRCGNRTGNNIQGHYWGLCKVTATIREFHFCCPDSCELGELDPNLVCPAPCGEPVKQGRILCVEHQAASDARTIAELQILTRPPGMVRPDVD